MRTTDMGFKSADTGFKSADTGSVSADTVLHRHDFTDTDLSHEKNTDTGMKHTDTDMSADIRRIGIDIVVKYNP